MTRILLIICLLHITLESWGQERFRVMTWNVENLFDCRDDTMKQDEEFLPESKRKWTWLRMRRKITDIGRVVMAVGGDRPPSLVALQEVENDSVMNALTRSSALRTLGYDYIMTDSPDKRGVDVALMFRREDFRILGWETRRVPSISYGLRPTRDILHAWGIVANGDTLHAVVCHLPSKAGRQRQGKRNRRLALATLASLCDSLLASGEGDRRLIVMGDFNSPLWELRPLRMLLPMTPDEKWPTEGTYRFRSNWSWIDHIMVSPALKDCTTEARIYSADWMQRPVADGTWYPRRTYQGTTYAGGVSDHLPISCDLRL